MFTLTISEVALLGFAVLFLLVLVVGACGAFLRTRRIVPAIVQCPVLGAAVTADLELDKWGVRFVDVAFCPVRHRRPPVTCGRACIAADAPMPVRRTA